MSIVTRFAPSPTGFLHIGGARTALFNWLYAKHMGGQFLLRVEDTDRKRSTPESIKSILDGLQWLGLYWDGDIVYQFARRQRHAEVAHQLLDAGLAYRCYCTKEELAEMRARAKAAGRVTHYDGTWRDRPASEAPPGVDPAIRFKAPRNGTIILEDVVQGNIELQCSQLDDLVMLRADGTPTYMLSVVVDDHDMGVTHVIRGDDHLTNAFRQAQIFGALEWDTPTFAHIPLLHGSDGTKLSKRHGALGVDAYRDMGLLPEAVLNYLCRLGWSHGDDEIFSIEQAIEWFDIRDVNKGPARLDPEKLFNLNGHYLTDSDNSRLAQVIVPKLSNTLKKELSSTNLGWLELGMSSLKTRAKSLNELAESARFYAADRPVELSERAVRLLDPEACQRLARLKIPLAALDPWTESTVEEEIRAFAKSEGIGLGKVAQPLRAALTGSHVSPGIFEVAAILGPAEALGRIDDVLDQDMS